MPISHTIVNGRPFEYTRTEEGELRIHYSKSKIRISADLLERISGEFGGRQVLGNFNLNTEYPDSFGTWIEHNTTFSSKHASRIASVLLTLGIIAQAEGNPLMLHFAPNAG